MRKRMINFRMLSVIIALGVIVSCTKDSALTEMYDTQWEPIEVHHHEIRASDDHELSLERTEITAPKQGISVEVGVKSNLDYTIHCPANWVTINKLADKVNIQIKASPENKVRLTHIEFVAKGEVKARIDITQLEKELHHTLPFIEFGKDLVGIEAFEHKRGGRLIHKEGELDRFAHHRYDISNIDQNFREVHYIIDNHTQTYTRSLLIIKSGGTFSSNERAGFEEYLLTQGFVKQKIRVPDFSKKPMGDNLMRDNEGIPSLLGEDGILRIPLPPDVAETELVETTVFIHKDKQAVIRYMPIEGNLHYSIDYVPMQTKVNKTFEKLPTYKKKTTEEEIMEEMDEKNQEAIQSTGKPKYTLMKEHSKEFKEGNTINYRLVYQVSNPKADEPSFIEHIFYIRDRDKGSNPPYSGRKSVIYYYKDMSLALYVGVDDRQYVTNEFKNLLEKEGYKYQIGSRFSGHIYVNPDRGSIAVKWASPLPNVSPMLRLQVF